MESLPDEIREKIYGKLSARDLLQALGVDHYTRSIIENSSVLMQKLPLFITETDEFSDHEKAIEPMMISRRKITKVIVELEREKIMKYLAIFKKFGGTIRILEIKNYAFETVDQLRMILRFLPSLHSLKVTNVTFQEPENKFLNAIVQSPKSSLSQLRNFDSNNSDPKIFSLFAGNQDVQLSTIRLQVNDSQTFSYGDFFKTMSQQTRLRHLRFDGITSENSDIFDSDDLLQCQLDALVIKNCKIIIRDQMRNLIQLIRNQKKLKILKILHTKISTSMDMMTTYRQIFSNCITDVLLDIGDLSFFHSNQFTNRTVRSLTLHGNFAFENLPIFINFIKIFPNVVRLTLVGNQPIGDKYLFQILTTFKNLEELLVPGFESRNGDSNFANLSSIESKVNTLVLDYIDYNVKFFGWKNIVTNLSGIEKLVIKKDIGKVSNEILDMIVKKLKLQHLELGIGVITEEILRTIIWDNCCNQLKVLKIPKSDLKKIENKFDFKETFSRNQLLLYLCKDSYFHFNHEVITKRSTRED